MSNIRIGNKADRTAGLFLPKTDLNLFQLIKTKQTWTCQKCDREIGVGIWCLGSGRYRKVCLACAEQFLLEVRKNVMDWINKIDGLSEDLLFNKTKYADENTLANLKH